MSVWASSIVSAAASPNIHNIHVGSGNKSNTYQAPIPLQTMNGGGASSSAAATDARLRPASAAATPSGSSSSITGSSVCIATRGARAFMHFDHDTPPYLSVTQGPPHTTDSNGSDPVVDPHWRFLILEYTPNDASASRPASLPLADGSRVLVCVDSPRWFLGAKGAGELFLLSAPTTLTLWTVKRLSPREFGLLSETGHWLADSAALPTHLVPPASIGKPLALVLASPGVLPHPAAALMAVPVGEVVARASSAPASSTEPLTGTSGLAAATQSGRPPLPSVPAGPPRHHGPGSPSPPNSRDSPPQQHQQPHQQQQRHRRRSRSRSPPPPPPPAPPSASTINVPIAIVSAMTKRALCKKPVKGGSGSIALAMAQAPRDVPPVVPMANAGTVIGAGSTPASTTPMVVDKAGAAAAAAAVRPATLGRTMEPHDTSAIAYYVGTTTREKIPKQTAELVAFFFVHFAEPRYAPVVAPQLPPPQNNNNGHLGMAASSALEPAVAPPPQQQRQPPPPPPPPPRREPVGWRPGPYIDLTRAANRRVVLVASDTTSFLGMDATTGALVELPAASDAALWMYRVLPAHPLACALQHVATGRYLAMHGGSAFGLAARSALVGAPAGAGLTARKRRGNNPSAANAGSLQPSTMDALDAAHALRLYIPASVGQAVANMHQKPPPSRMILVSMAICLSSLISASVAITSLVLNVNRGPPAASAPAKTGAAQLTRRNEYNHYVRRSGGGIGPEEAWPRKDAADPWQPKKDTADPWPIREFGG
ncbi:hypothetical protein BC828DRAFT_382644 [Blastocladiella britannica]|nr:hypothetical protein BC828DRAFT_382644 [Blastocladiella britannica]